MTTITDPRLRELRTKLINLVDDVDDRLTNHIHGDLTLLETLLDRLAHLVSSVTDELLCVRCPNPATFAVEAGDPHTFGYRAEIVCAACLRVSQRWVSLIGPARVKPFDPRLEANP